MGGASPRCQAEELLPGSLPLKFTQVAPGGGRALSVRSAASALVRVRGAYFYDDALLLTPHVS